MRPLTGYIGAIVNPDPPSGFRPVAVHAIVGVLPGGEAEAADDRPFGGVGDHEEPVEGVGGEAHVGVDPQQPVTVGLQQLDGDLVAGGDKAVRAEPHREPAVQVLAVRGVPVPHSGEGVLE
jgi:hypothetical protein